jgi:hypothetical protein
VVPVAVQRDEHDDNVLAITLTETQRVALGWDRGPMVEMLDTALTGVANARGAGSPHDGPRLKDGRTDLEWQQWVIRDTTDLIQRLTGLQNAAIRAHAEQGGTYNQLAEALRVGRSTAQRRRDGVVKTDPNALEMWASKGTHQPKTITLNQPIGTNHFASVCPCGWSQLAATAASANANESEHVTTLNLASEPYDIAQRTDTQEAKDMTTTSLYDNDPRVIKLSDTVYRFPERSNWTLRLESDGAWRLRDHHGNAIDTITSTEGVDVALWNFIGPPKKSKK